MSWYVRMKINTIRLFFLTAPEQTDPRDRILIFQLIGMKLSQFTTIDLATNDNYINDAEVNELLEAAAKDKKVAKLDVSNKEWDLNNLALKFFEKQCSLTFIALRFVDDAIYS